MDTTFHFLVTPAGVIAGAAWLAADPALLATARHLARYPLATYDLLGALVGEAQDRGARDRVAALRARGLVARIAVPRPVGGQLHVHHLSDLGLAIVGRAGAQDPVAIAARHGGTAPALVAALADIEATLGRYGALALLLRAAPGRPTVLRWQAPWIAPVGDGGADAAVRLPALADVVWRDDAPGHTVDERRASALLLPDLPGCPIDHWAAPLARYLARQIDGRPAWQRWDAAPLLIATTDDRRYDWVALLDRLLRPYGLGGEEWYRRQGPIVLVEAAVGRRLHPYALRCPRYTPPPSLFDMNRDPAQYPLEPLLPPGVPDVPALPAGAGPVGAPPALVDAALAAALPAIPALQLLPTRWRVLDLVAKLPLRRDGWLARDLDWHPATLHRALADLARLGLIRRFEPRDPAEFFPTAAGRARAAALCAAHRPVEATVAGLAALAARAGLTPAETVARSGYAGGGPGRDAAGRPLAFGDRAALAVNYLHTDGLYGLLAHLIDRVDADPTGGTEVTWALGSAGGGRRIRPDAHVEVIRQLPASCHAAFVEYDRGTEDTEDYRRKLGAYRAHYARRPARAATALLFITTKPSHELLLIDAARRELATAGVPLLLTTTTRLAADPDGMLGPIWRTPWSAERRRWVPPPPPVEVDWTPWEAAGDIAGED